MFWKGTAWSWVGGGMRRDDFQTSSIQRAAGGLRQSAWLRSTFFLKQSPCVLTLFALQLSWFLIQFPCSLHDSLFISPDHSLLLCFCVVSKPLFPCPARRTSGSLYFCLYSIALQLLWDASSLKSRAMLCVPPCLQKQAWGIISRRCTVHGVQCLKTLRLLLRSAAMEAVVVERLMYALSGPQLLHLASHHASSHKWMWNSFSANWTVLITSPFVHLEASTQLNTIRKLHTFFLKVYRGDENFSPWVSGCSH